MPPSKPLRPTHWKLILLWAKGGSVLCRPPGGTAWLPSRSPQWFPHWDYLVTLGDLTLSSRINRNQKAPNDPT